jgi:hypothetical protein
MLLACHRAVLTLRMARPASALALFASTALISCTPWLSSARSLPHLTALLLTLILDCSIIAAATFSASLSRCIACVPRAF